MRPPPPALQWFSGLAGLVAALVPPRDWFSYVLWAVGSLNLLAAAVRWRLGWTR